jgi:hypothetical protein
MIGVLWAAAKGIFSSVLRPYIEDTKNTAMNSARDTLEAVVTGRRSIDEWANIAIDGVDQIKERAIEEGDLRYVGGKLNFAMSTENAQKVVISFELYFLDENNQWHKIGADSDMAASNFTVDSLEEIADKGIVSFDVEA